MIRSLRWGLLLLSLLFLSMLSMPLRAQQLYTSPITVQYTDGKVSYFDTLDEAFMALKAGCVVYIPSGSYTLSSKEGTKVKCQVAIYGVGCRPYGKDTDYTHIKGDIVLEEDASFSIITRLYSESGIYVQPNVKNILIKNVDVNHIVFSEKSNTDCLVTSSVIRGYIFGNFSAPIQVKNCLANDVEGIKGGEIANCILKSSFVSTHYYFSEGCLLRNNIGLDMTKAKGISNCQEECNMVGDESQIPYPSGGLEALFEKYDASDPFNLSKNNYRLKKGVSGTNAGTDGKDIGLYGGSGFDDSGRAPISKIKIREMASKTDEQNRLRVKIEIVTE